MIARLLRTGMLLAWLLSAGIGVARAHLVVDSAVNQLDPLPQLSFYEDPTGALTAPDLLQRPTLFQPYRKSSINEGYTYSAWWFTFTLSNNEQTALHWWLTLDYPMLDHADLYLVDTRNNQILSSVFNGDETTLDSRPIAIGTFVFPLKLEPQREYRLLLRLRSTGSLIAPMRLSSEAEFTQHLASQRLMFGVFHGGALFLMLYNIGLLLVVRERLYLYYVLYALSFLMVSLYATGVGSEYLWRDQFLVQSGALPFFLQMCCWFGLLFSRNLLALRTRAPRLHQISQVLIGLYILTLLLLPLLPYTYSIQIVMGNALLAIGFALVSGTHGVFTHYAPARNFMLGWFALLASGVVFILTAANLLHANVLSVNSLQVGSSIELLMLSFALADHIALLKKQKSEVESLAQAEQLANKSKSDFLAAMSHEIRTPMSGVLGMTELMENTALNHEQKQYLETIKDSSRALLDIINQILDLSKIEADRLELEQIDFALEEVIAETCKVFYARRQSSPIRFETLLDPDLPSRLHGDPTRLRQVLINLIGNAYKFTEKGSITLTVRTDTPTGRIHFAVTDTGPGIAPSALSRIFEHYQQETQHTTRVHGGTGLGLSIARQLVERMGGDINVQSQLGEGTSFWFTLPGPSQPVPPLLTGNDSARNTSLYLLTNSLALQRQLTVWCKKIPLSLEINRWPNATEQVEKLVILSDDIVQLRQSTSLLACRVHCHLLAQRHADAEQTEFPATELPLLPSRFLHILSRRDTAPAETPATVDDSKPISIQRVLLAEDNPVNAQVIKGLLKRLGVATDWCQNGKEAVEKLQQGHYDLVFMDCEMPVLDGYAATRQIREAGHDRQIIVALTAHAIKEYVDMAYAAGMNDYLTKPIDLSTLRKTLQYWSTPPA